MKSKILLLNVFLLLRFGAYAQTAHLSLSLNGNGTDASSYSNSTTVGSAVTWGVDAKGNSNSAAVFDGSSTNSGISVANSPSIDLSKFGDITFSLWFKPEHGTSLSNLKSLLYCGNASDSNMAIIFDSASRKVTFYNYNSLGNPLFSLITNATFDFGTWYHYTVTIANNLITVYVNGAYDNSATATTTRPSNTSISIGYNFNASLVNDSNWKYVGSIDEVKIYAGALTANQVSSLYLNGSFIPTGIPSVSSAAFTVYPTLCHDHITIKQGTVNGVKMKIALYDIRGVKIRETFMENDNYSVDDLAAGCYFLNITSGDQQAVYKIVKQ